MEEPTTDASPTPRASVLIPSFNHAPFVLGAVESALDQTEPAIEVIVIDDGSTDDSLARLATIDDPRVRVLSQANQGLSRTLNRGLELARAPWIKFLPSDDMLAPGCIELQLRAADELGRGVVFCLPEVVDAGGRPLADPAPQAWFDTAVRDGAEILVGLVERNFLSAPGALFERDLARAVGGFDPELCVAQDYDLWLKLLPRGPARLLPDRLVRVRWHGANQSAVATPATEAERSRALLRAVDDVGLEHWVARFTEGSSGRRAGVQGRLALAGALRRSGLPDATALAERIALEASRLERGGGGVRVATSVRRALAATFQVARRHLRPRWRVALDGKPAAATGSGAASATPIASGPCHEHWLVLDPAPVVLSGERARGAELALALARRGLRVTYAAPTADAATVAAAAIRGAAAVAPIGWHLPTLRALLASGDDALRLLLEAPHPEAVALAREAASSGARVLYDRGVPPQTLAGASWYDAESEKRLIDEADDLIISNAAFGGGGGGGARRRVVHVLPSPDATEDDPAEREWDARAASLAQIASRPSTSALLIGRGDDREVAVALAALVAARRTHAHRIAVVLVEPIAPEVQAAVEAAPDATLLRCARPDLGAARELGLRATSGEVVVWLTAEAAPLLRDGWLAPALSILRERREVGAVALGGPDGWGGANGERDRASGPVPPFGANPISWVDVAVLGGPIVVARRAVVARLARSADIAPGPAHSLADADRELGERIRSAGYRLVAPAGAARG